MTNDRLTGGLLTCLVPTADPTLPAALDRSRAILTELGELDFSAGLPAPIAGGTAARAAAAVAMAVWPPGVEGVRVFGPGRRTEYRSIRFASVPADSLAVLGSAGPVLGRLVLTEDPAAGRVLEAYAGPTGESVVDLVAELAGVHGLLDLQPTIDTDVLEERLGRAAPGGTVVFTPAEERAYQRATQRIARIWSLSVSVDQHRS